MRICASLSKAGDLACAADADMIEIRLDLLGSVPDVGDVPAVITFRDGFDASLLPCGFKGYVDVGEGAVPDISALSISSYHD